MVKSFDRFLMESRRHVRGYGRPLRENEEDWISQANDMEGDSDFDKLDLEQSSEEATRRLAPEEQEELRDFIESQGMGALQDLIKASLVSRVSESEEEMSDREYRIRRIVDKVITYSSVGSALAIVPAAMFIGAGVAAGLGVYALVSNTLRDAAWFKRGGYDKYKTGHHYERSDRSRHGR